MNAQTLVAHSAGGERELEVQTVTGRISGSEMGITLPHEHILVDMRPFWSRPFRDDEMCFVDAEVSMDMVGFLSHNMLACKDNLTLNDPDVATKELLRFKALGGQTIVEMTNRGISPKPQALRDISMKSGTNIVAGCGYYLAQTHPPSLEHKSVDQLAEEIIGDIQQGIDGTGVKPGIIGEIGTSHPLFENEKKVLRAAARAHRSTGLAVSVHMAWQGQHGEEVLDILESEKMDPTKVIIDHMDDMQEVTFEYQKAIAERGAYVELDCFGQENYVDSDNFIHPRDIERVKNLTRLVESGYIDRILISQDVYLKMYLRTYGGYGYDHILRTILPMLKRSGLTERETDKIIKDNPRRAIAY